MAGYPKATQGSMTRAVALQPLIQLRIPFISGKPHVPFLGPCCVSVRL